MTLKSYKIHSVVNKKHIQQLLHMSHLKESSIFKEIVALNKNDVQCLRELGILLYEQCNDPLRWKQFVNKSLLDSPMFSILQRYSQNALKNFPDIFWIGDDEDKHINKYIIGSIFDQTVIHIFKNECFRVPKKVLVTNLKKENIVLYFPLVADFILYYIKSSKEKEGFEKLTILKYVNEVLEIHKTKKLVLYYLDKLHIVDEVINKHSHL